KYRLLHLAGVAGAADEDQPLAEVDGDDDVGVGAVPLGIGLETRRIDHRELRARRFGGLRIVDEQIAAEQAVPRVLGDYADRQTVGRIGAGVDVLNEDFLTGQGTQQLGVERIEVRRVHRPIHLAPRDLALAGRIADDELVVGRATCVLTGPARERSAGGDHALLAAYCVLVQCRDGEVPANTVSLNPLSVEASGAVNLGAHQTTPKTWKRSNIRRIRRS